MSNRNCAMAGFFLTIVVQAQERLVLIMHICLILGTMLHFLTDGHYMRQGYWWRSEYIMRAQVSYLEHIKINPVTDLGSRRQTLPEHTQYMQFALIDNNPSGHR